jgi:hypothetical protein
MIEVCLIIPIIMGKKIFSSTAEMVISTTAIFEISSPSEA